MGGASPGRARPRPVAVASSLESAKARLDTLELYPRPVRIDRVRVIVSPAALPAALVPPFRRLRRLGHDPAPGSRGRPRRRSPLPRALPCLADAAPPGRDAALLPAHGLRARTRTRPRPAPRSTPPVTGRADRDSRRRGSVLRPVPEAVRLSSGAELRVTHASATAAVICSERRPGAGGSRSLGLVARVARRAASHRAFPSWRSRRCATGSGRGAGSTNASRTAARRSRRPASGRSSCSASRWAAPLRSRPPATHASRASSASHRGSPTGSTSRRFGGGASTSCTARSTAGLPAIPGVAPSVSRRGFDRAQALGVEGSYTLIRGGVHGLCVRVGERRFVELPRARTWVSLVAARLDVFSGTLWEG